MKPDKMVFVFFLLVTVQHYAQVAVVGSALPPWQKGYLDLHHINTGWGNAAYFIFPDGTTLLFDAGEMNPTDNRAFTPRNAAMKPNYSRKAHEWIAHYIRQVAPVKDSLQLDYAVISHFHDDHFGSWYPGAPLAIGGRYYRSGITGVADLIPIRHLLDRGYPAYNYPYDMKRLALADSSGEINYAKTMQNYFNFITAAQAKGMQVSRLKAGSRKQIHMLYNAGQYPNFYVQGIKSNGLIWTGKDSTTYQHFPMHDTGNRKTWPDENALSQVLTLNYGPFRYYTGGDCPGTIFPGDPLWRDVETPVAKAIGEVDVATMDHHGNRDAVNALQVMTFKPRVWIGQSWSSDHPGHEVLLRLTSSYSYDGPRDLFTTNMLEANRYVIGPLVERSYKSLQGHIVVRVLPGGESYYVIILDDSREDLRVKEIFGPYASKKK